MGTIAEKLNYLNTTKTNIKNAIIEKGVSVSDNDTFRSYASKIADIEPTLGTKTITANGTYTASDDSLQGYSSVTVDIDDTDLYRDTTDSTYESVKTLSNCGAFPMLSLTAEINAVQDLHGYDKPWAGGAGKNKCNPTSVLSSGGISASLTNDTIIASGKSLGNGDVGLYITPITLNANTSYTLSLSGTDTRSGALYVYFKKTDNSYISVDSLSPSQHAITYIPTESISIESVLLRTIVSNTITLNAKMQIEEGSTATTFSPYSNICPITGWDSIDVYQSGIDTSNPTTHTTALSTTCYGGSKDIKGNERFTHGHIASYNGETLPSTWISDRDEYAEGTTPTTGAEVVYELATPTTATSDDIDLTLAEGVNNIWANSGDVGDARYFRKVEL